MINRPVLEDNTVAAKYEAAGFTGGFSLGLRPALVVVDLSLGFTDAESPLGSHMPEIIQESRKLLDSAREHNVFTVFTTIAFDPGSLKSLAWVRKVPSLALLETDSRWVEIDPALGRLDSEPLVVKTGASAFFGTPLQSMLVGMGIDTVLVAGATTSGCVRATVVDGVQAGYSTFVIRDCVFDRATGPHEASLFDMTAKYADAVTAQEVIGYFERLAAQAAPP